MIYWSTHTNSKSLESNNSIGCIKGIKGPYIRKAELKLPLIHKNLAKLGMGRQ